MKTQLLPEVKSRISQVFDDLVKKHRKCGGTGYVPADVSGAVHRCGCMIVFRYLKELIKANIPQDYWRLSVDKLKINPLLKKVITLYLKNLERAKQNGLGLVLLGQNGTGKTSTMAEIAKHAIVSGYKVRYFTLSSYVDAIYSKESERIEYYEDGDFLLIDELDKKAGTSNVYKLVDEFLRRMFNQNKCLVLGTNWDQGEFCEHLGESTYSLLKRRCEFLAYAGEDYSDHLQDSYIDRLESDFDYFNSEIVARAIEREEAQFDVSEE